MKRIILKAPAKLNFNLHILPEKLANGYFKVKFLNHQAALADTIILEEIPSGIKLICDDSRLAIEETNLACKAAEVVIKQFAPQKGVKIFLQKKIPVAGGLGGGSADAAAVILGLDKLWNLKLTDLQKLELAKNLGMDVCYSVIGGTCLIEGAGEKVTRLDFSLPPMPLIIISPPYAKPSTAWAYRTLDPKKIGCHLEKLEKLISAIKKKDILAIITNLHNDFEPSIFKAYNEVKRIKKEILKTGAVGALLCGSGLSVFGIFPNRKLAKRAIGVFLKKYPRTYLTETL